ncbi:MAG TPA: RNA polymerase sigma factor [Bryobacteraceae bacterium]|nr:RNA polymerase sigma factor [Bryobacteraceae bacterium]
MSEGAIDDRELRDLMIRYQRADAAALEELFRRVSPSLLRYFSGSGVGRNDAEDLLQECWIRIHRSRHTYRSSELLMPWIYAIARHTRLDGYRRRRRLESREVLVESLPDHVSEAARQAPREEDDFASLVASLPEGQREVLVMLKVSGMSLEEVAEATASTVGAVKQKVHRAYTALRRALREDRENARQS